MSPKYRTVQDAEAQIQAWLALFCMDPGPQAIRRAAFALLDHVGGPGRGLADVPAGTFDLRKALDVLVSS